jgi:succinate dehydrogenase hydrophobic anchor subunit
MAGRRTLIRESRLMWLQYATGLVIFVLGALHFASLTFLEVANLDEALSFEMVAYRYTNLLWAGSLELFLLVLSYHIFNGFRVVLLELNQGRAWTTAVNTTMLLAGLTVFLYGTRTIVIFLLGGVG